jgi:hypothetical protein
MYKYVNICIRCRYVGRRIYDINHLHRGRLSSMEVSHQDAGVPLSMQTNNSHHCYYKGHRHDVTLTSSTANNGGMVNRKQNKKVEVTEGQTW